MGILANIFTWRDTSEMFELASFVGCTRPGYTLDAAPDGQSVISDFTPASWAFLMAPMVLAGATVVLGLFPAPLEAGGSSAVKCVRGCGADRAVPRRP